MLEYNPKVVLVGLVQIFTLIIVVYNFNSMLLVVQVIMNTNKEQYKHLTRHIVVCLAQPPLLAHSSCLY